MAEKLKVRDRLWSDPQVWADFYRDGLDLGQIAQKHGCSIYDLSPWLTAPIVRVALQASSGDAAGARHE